jgi:hypothetical protein
VGVEAVAISGSVMEVLEPWETARCEDELAARMRRAAVGEGGGEDLSSSFEVLDDSDDDAAVYCNVDAEEPQTSGTGVEMSL